MKTSSFPSADALDGAELVGVVQDGTNVKATTVEVSSVTAYRPYVMIGFEATLYGFSSIAIGEEASATGSTSSIAIGLGGQADGSLAMSIGTITYVTGNNSMAVGAYTFNAETAPGVTMVGAGNEGNTSYGTAIGTNIINSNNQVAIGRGIDGAEGCVWIGTDFNTLEPAVGVAIGKEIGTYGPLCVGIGTNSRAIYRGVSIGYNSGFHNVSVFGAGESSIAIGPMSIHRSAQRSASGTIVCRSTVPWRWVPASRLTRRWPSAMASTARARVVLASANR
jgi:hypothetical protein